MINRKSDQCSSPKSHFCFNLVYFLFWIFDFIFLLYRLPQMYCIFNLLLHDWRNEFLLILSTKLLYLIYNQHLNEISCNYFFLFVSILYFIFSRRYHNVLCECNLLLDILKFLLTFTHKPNNIYICTKD